MSSNTTNSLHFSSALKGSRRLGSRLPASLRLTALFLLVWCILPALAYGQTENSPQLPCPVRTDVNLTTDSRNNVRCNVFAIVNISSTGTFFNESDGTILVGDDHQPPVFFGTLFNSGKFANSGQIIVEPTTGILVNAGSMNIFLGGVTNFNTMFNQGTLNLQFGGTINNEASGTLTNFGVFTNASLIQNGGLFENQSGSSGSYTNLSGGSLSNLDGGVFNNNSQFNNNLGAKIVNQGGATLNNHSVLENFGGIINSAGGSFANSFVLNNDSGSTLNNAGNFTNSNVFANYGTTNNTGSLQNLAGGILTNFGTMNNSGALGNSGSFQIGGGGILNNTGSIGNFTGGSFSVQAGGTLNNSGSLISDLVSGFGTGANSTVVNTGSMSLSGNTVTVGGNFRNDGSVILTGGFLQGDIPIFVPPPPMVVTSTGTLSGTGVVNGNVILQGTMHPGDSPGIFTINGNYTQDPGGILDILLGGTGAGQFGELVVNGSAQLGGTLDVELFAGFDPAAGEIFKILSGNISGAFANVLFPTLGDGLFFKLDQEANGIFLDVLAGTDGGGNGGGGGNTTVPEPSTFAMIGVSFAALFGYRGRKRFVRE